MERCLEPLLFGYFHGNNANFRNLSGSVFDGNVMFDPMPWLSPVVKHETNFKIQDGLCGSAKALELWFYQFGEITQHLPDGLSQMFCRRYAIHLRQRRIDCKIAEAGVQKAKTDPERAEIGG